MAEKSKSDVPLKKPEMKSSIPPDAVKLADRASKTVVGGKHPAEE